ncbi:macrophage mannose receptor 1-like [Mya arenaria]|uniref:macrophage mannose receptor 1-like n=1 Tax=Mya arenaria TaxID=6604 RepID=UPI0022E37592|nr:macrophage mannose receptor 1-like [Mya arenaria]
MEVNTVFIVLAGLVSLSEAMTTAAATYGCGKTAYTHAAANNGVLFAIDQTCYELIKTHHPWQRSEDDCVSRGGHLAHIENAQQQDRIFQVVTAYHGDNVWIGLNDKTTEETFEWSSGDAVTYTNWVADRLNPDFHYNEDCVAMSFKDQGKWEDVFCTLAHSYAYVCEYDAVAGVSMDHTTLLPAAALMSDGDSSLCPSHLATSTRHLLAQYEQSCYELLLSTSSWTRAETTCTHAGGKVLLIDNANEQNYIEGFLKRHHQTDSVWLDISDRNIEGTFETSAGTAPVYTNWKPNYFSANLHSREDCVAMFPTVNGTWDDISCTSSHHVVCEYGLATVMPGVIVLG